MGIIVEFNPDLTLRDFSECRKGNRKKEECIPERLNTGKEYRFLKRGQRNYWFGGEVPLVRTMGNQNLSLPLASVLILEATHKTAGGEVWTEGRYRVTEVFKDGRPRWNGFAKI